VLWDFLTKISLQTVPLVQSLNIMGTVKGSWLKEGQLHKVREGNEKGGRFF
jgi:hypothetical protein